MCAKIHTSAPGRGHRLRLGHSRAGEGTDDTGPLFLTPGCARHMGMRAPGLLPTPPSPRGRISAVKPTSWGCSLERSDLASSHFRGVPPPQHPCTTLQWSQMTEPGLKFPDQTRRPRAQAGSQCVATCQASCQVGQGSHSKAAG